LRGEKQKKVFLFSACDFEVGSQSTSTAALARPDRLGGGKEDSPAPFFRFFFPPSESPCTAPLFDNWAATAGTYCSTLFGIACLSFFVACSRDLSPSLASFALSFPDLENVDGVVVFIVALSATLLSAPPDPIDLSKRATKKPFVSSLSYEARTHLHDEQIA